MSRRARTAAIAAAAIVVWTLGAGRLQADEGDGPARVTFHFTRAAESSYVRTFRSTSTKDFQGVGTRTDVTRHRTDVIVLRQPEGGYRVEATVAAHSVEINGSPSKNELASIAEGTTLVHLLDPDGHLLGLEGLDGLLEAVRARLSAEDAEALKPTLGSDARDAKERADYESRVGQFLGRTVAIGERWRRQATYALPNGGSLEYVEAIVFAALVPCGTARCVRIEFTQQGRREADDFETSLEAHGHRLIDPDTMRLHGESLERKLVLPYTIPHLGRTSATITESARSQFEHGRTVAPAGS